MFARLLNLIRGLAARPRYIPMSISARSRASEVSDVEDLLHALSIAAMYEPKSLADAKMLALAILDWAYDETGRSDADLRARADDAFTVKGRA